MNGVILYPLINQPDSCLQISERNKRMRSFVLDNNGYLTLPLFKCATSADNYAGACWTNEGEFDQIFIKGESFIPRHVGLLDIHVEKQPHKKGSQTQQEEDIDNNDDDIVLRK